MSTEKAASVELTGFKSTLADLQRGFNRTIEGARQLGSNVRDKLSTPTALRRTGIGFFFGSQTVFRFLEGIFVRYPGELVNSLKYTVMNIPNNPIWSTITVEMWQDMLHGSKDALTAVINNYSVGITGGIGGALLVAGTITLLNAPGEKAKHVEADYLTGELSVKPKGSQIFAVGGESSNAVDQLVLNQPDKVTPIFETAQGGGLIAERLAPERLKQGRGSFINLGLDKEGPRTYGSADTAWEKLIVSEDNLIHTPDGKRILLVAGFGERSEEELTQSPTETDVTQDELHTATQKIVDRFKTCGVDMEGVEIVKAYFGSAKVKRPNPDTQKLTDTDRQVAEVGGIAIYVDTWSAIVAGIAEELGKTPIRLSTRVPEYRGLFNTVAKSLGVDLVSAKKDKGQAAILVYERITDNAINALKQLLGAMPNRRIYALISSVSGQEMAESQGFKDKTISTAIMLSKVAARIGNQLQAGTSAAKIQANLDQLWKQN